MKHLVIIDPAMQRAEFECFNEISKRAPMPVTYHLPGLYGTASLESETLSEVAGIMVLGSAASVLSPLSWQSSLKEWLRSAFSANLPVLGICYGHQLIASMFGAEVGFVSPSHDKLTGLRRISLQPGNHPGSGTVSTSGDVVISHREEVKNCPSDFYVLASSPNIAIDGLAHKSKPIYSFQFHPEATEAFLQNQGIVISAERFPAYGLKLVEAFLKVLSH